MSQVLHESHSVSAERYAHPSNKLRLVLCLAVMHLGLVLLGAIDTVFSNDNPIGRSLTYYGAASGAGNSYGFFAPGIFSQIRAVFDVTDQNGQTHPVVLESKTSHEADLRISNIIEQFANDFDDPMEFQRALAASLASTMFNREPAAKSVNVRIERYTPVSMEDYRKGTRSIWTPEYSAKFVYKRGLAKQ